MTSFKRRRDIIPVQFRGLAIACLLLGFAASARPQAEPARAVLLQNVRVFNGTDKLSAPTNVLVVSNQIAKISTGAITAPPGATVTTIEGGGRTLMPGLIDAHVHMMFNSLPQIALLTSDIEFVTLASGKAATGMLMRGYTGVRDLGGPSFGLKKAIDLDLVPGPRIWPAGTFISQTGGHGDFRLPTELPAAPGSFDYTQRVGASAIADDAGTVRLRAREQLALGASQIKMMAVGGVASSYDPLDVT
jgi:imidazolonepropionase-like amidohydrolase